MSERSNDDLADEWADRQSRRSQACKCSGDMPGYCPGPASCPMCQPDDEEDARVAADLSYNAAKPMVYERQAETAMRNEIAMRILTREPT